MAILRNVTFLAVASWMAATAGPFGPLNANAANVSAASCRRKTAGFYLLEGPGRPLPVALQGLPESLAGAQGATAGVIPAPSAAEANAAQKEDASKVRGRYGGWNSSGWSQKREGWTWRPGWGWGPWHDDDYGSYPNYYGPSPYYAQRPYAPPYKQQPQ